MKKIILAAVVAAISVPAAAAPGDTATAAGAASAEIVSPIAITHDVGAVLSFGTLTAGNGGTVVVNRNNGNGSSTGDVSLVAGTATSADSFTVTGDANRTFSIATTDSTVDDAGNSMNFTTSARNNGTLDGTGSVVFTVGGTLTVPDSQPAGSYTGTYDATVTYN